jgi:signal transduction histidine kinase
VVIAVIQGAMWITVSVYQRDAIRQVHDDRLRDRLTELVGQVRDADPETWAETAGNPVEDVSLAIYDEDGRAALVAGARLSRDVWDRVASQAETLLNSAGLGTKNDEGRAPLRVAGRPFRGADGRFYTAFVASSDVLAQQAQMEAERVIAVAAAASLLLLFGATWFIAGAAVRPILSMQKLATEITPEHMPDLEKLQSRSSETAHMQEELAAAFERIEEGYRAQSRFLTNVSHELKTPISVILAQAQTMPGREDLPAPAREFVESVSGEMRRLGRMIESFLLLSRVREGKTRVHDRLYPANDLVIDSIVNTAEMAELHGVRVNPTLAEAHDELLVFGDPELLGTAVDNLVRNAIRFTPEGDGVDVRVMPNGDAVAIGVRDYGPGVPEDQLDAIFDRFARVQTMENQGRGSGLGLEIARSITELHGGTITVENREPGCEFMIRLPKASEEDPFPAEEEEE